MSSTSERSRILFNSKSLMSGTFGAAVSSSRPVSTRVSNGVVGAIAVVASLTLLFSLNKSMWIDEGASLYSAHLSWGALWQQSHVVDRVFLGYYSFLHVWLVISNTIEWARAASLAAYAITVFLTGHFAVRLGGLTCGVIAALVCATSPLLISASLDARPYALATLASTASAMALIRWYEGGAVRWLWLFCLAAIAVMVLQIFLVLAPLTVLGAAVVTRPRRFLDQWRSWSLPIGLLLIVGASLAVAVVGQRDQISWIPSMNAAIFGDDVTGLVSGGPLFLHRSAFEVILGLLVVVLLVLSASGWRYEGNRPLRGDLDLFVICLSWAIIPTAFLLLVSFIHDVYVARYVTASVPGMAIAIGLLASYAFRQTGRARRRKAIVATSTVMILTTLLVVTAVASSREYVENVKGASQYLASHAKKNDEVALPDHVLTAIVEYYYPAHHYGVNIWPERDNQLHLQSSDLLEGPKILMRASRNVWLMTDFGAYGSPEFIGYLKRDGYVLVGEKTFYGALTLHVDHFRRSPT